MASECFTYENQPNDSVDCWRLGEACREAADEPKCGDYIDRGLILLRELQRRGFGIVRLEATMASESAVQQTHVLERTSPMGEPFIGRCTLCGTRGLTSRDATRECANPARIRADHALLAAIEGDDDGE